MIITVTANAALDITYEIDALVPHNSHRVRRACARAGGKGINVAAVLGDMSRNALVTGCIGGSTGDLIKRDLTERGLVHTFTELQGESRRTVNVVDDSGDATIFNEAGSAQDGATGERLVSDIAALLDRTGAGVVVVSGSLPTGMSTDIYAQIVEQAQARDAQAIVDAGGVALLAAVTTGPRLVKPNVAELTSATGTQDIREGIAMLRSAGARDVVVSAGADGLYFVPCGGPAWHAQLNRTLRGNPTGAGDAAVAALAAGLDEDWSPEEMVRRAVAWSAAAVLQPVAGAVDPRQVAELENAVVTKEIA